MEEGDDVRQCACIKLDAWFEHSRRWSAMHGLICMALSIRARSEMSTGTNYIPSSQSCMYRYYYNTLATPDSHRVLQLVSAFFSKVRETILVFYIQVLL